MNDFSAFVEILKLQNNSFFGFLLGISDRDEVRDNQCLEKIRVFEDLFTLIIKRDCHAIFKQNLVFSPTCK